MAEKPQLAMSPYLHLEAGYTQAIEYTAAGSELYHGWAVPSTADKAAAVWRICKGTYSTDASGVEHLTDVQWANGQETFKNIWNNRTLITYT